MSTRSSITPAAVPDGENATRAQVRVLKMCCILLSVCRFFKWHQPRAQRATMLGFRGNQ